MIITPSCKLYLPFEGNALDASGNGNNGTVYGAVLATGKFGQGYSFDGVDDSIFCGTNLGISGDASMSISAWFYTTDGINLQSMVVFGSIAILSAFSLFLNVAGSRAIGVEFQGGKYYRSTTNVYNINQWNHFVATKTPGAIATTTKMYLNGVEVSAATVSPGTPNISILWVDVGLWNHTEAGIKYYFNGSVDDVQIYNRALSESDIRRIMLSFHPLGG